MPLSAFGQYWVCNRIYDVVTPRGNPLDYYQGVVTDFLRANRALFLNTECCIQVNPGENPDKSGPHWFCDAVAVDFGRAAIFLCEVSYAKSLGSLVKRLSEWDAHWPSVLEALVRDNHLPQGWPVQPWVFVPKHCEPALDSGLARVREMAGRPLAMPQPRVTFLEEVAPWKYWSWNRRDDDEPTG